MKFFSFIILMFISSSKSSRDDSHNKQLSLGGIPTIDDFQNYDDLAGREKTCEARRTRVVHYCSPSGNLLIDYPTTLEDDVSIPLHRCFMFDALAKDKNVRFEYYETGNTLKMFHHSVTKGVLDEKTKTCKPESFTINNTTYSSHTLTEEIQILIHPDNNEWKALFLSTYDDQQSIQSLKSLTEVFVNVSKKMYWITWYFQIFALILTVYVVYFSWILIRRHIFSKKLESGSILPI